MRIVSKTHDYYDSVQGLGQDQDVLYIRKNEKVYTERNLGRNGIISNTDVPCFGDIYTHDPCMNTKGYTIGFCGKLYKVVEVWINKFGEYDVKHHFCYSVNDINKFVDENYKEEFVESFHSKKEMRWKSKWRGKKEVDYVKVFEPVDNSKYEWIFEKYKCPIWIYHSETYGNSGIEINPILNTYNFQKVFDPYMAYQELYMYLANQAKPMKPIPEIDDVTLAESKGFNEFSFRKDKKK